MHILGIASTAASLLGVVTNLNIKESSKTKLSAIVSTFFIADLCWVICSGTKQV